MLVLLSMDNKMERNRPALRALPRRSSVARAKADGARGKGRAVVLRRVPAVSRSIAILRLLGKSDAPLGVHAIASALKLVPSTCLHILRVLVAEELVSHDPDTKRYALGVGILSIARGLLGKRSIGETAQPFLDDLTRSFRATAICVEAVGLEHIVVVAISRTEQALRLRTDVGSRFPALISATGRCIAAFGGHAPEDLDRHFRTLRWDNPATLKDWHAEVEATRESGYAVDDGRYISGVAIIAAPIPSATGLRNVLVIVGIGDQIRRIGFATIGEALRARAIELSQRFEGAG
jgi:DNA-binding IclR family transcriptional regulator